MLDPKTIEAVTDDVIGECRSNGGTLTGEAFDAILFKHGLNSQTAPPPDTELARAEFMGRRRAVWSRVRTAIQHRNLWLKQIRVQTSLRGGEHQLIDAGEAQVELLREMPSVLPKRALPIVRGFNRFADSAALRHISPDLMREFRDMVMVEAEERSKSLRRVYNLAVRAVIEGGGGPQLVLPMME